MNKAKKPVIILVSLVMLLLLLTGAVSLLNYVKHDSVSLQNPLRAKVIVKHSYFGGLCYNDSVCDEVSYTIDYDGKLFAAGELRHTFDKSEIEKLDRLIDQLDLSEYKGAVNTSRGRLRCGSVNDGIDESYSFPRRSIIIGACAHNVPDDDPLFNYLDELLASTRY